MTRKALMLVAAVILLSATIKAEKKISITSEPSGARVEFNGTFIGVTPIEDKLKDHFFNGPKYLWSDYLSTPVRMTVSKDGYVAKTIVITEGPFRWVNLNNTAEKIYYVLTSKTFNVRLDEIGAFMGTNPLANPTLNADKGLASNGQGRLKLSTEEIVQRSLPSVVTVKAGNSSGSGFFITDTGVVVTNRHVVAGATSVSVIDSRGQSYQSSSVFAHPTNDLALIKISGPNFPYLRIADPSSLNVGADVIAMGSPGLPGYSDLLPNTVTRGIASAFRKEESYGILIQTDVAINSGNSGGPLLNSNGEVVGVSTLKFREGGATGINFAILCSEVLKMLKEHLNYVPSYLNATSNEVSPTIDRKEKVALEITSEPNGSEVFVNGNFESSTPAKLSLPGGEYVIKVVRPGYKAWERKITLEIGTSKTINAILEKEVESPK